MLAAWRPRKTAMTKSPRSSMPRPKSPTLPARTRLEHVVRGRRRKPAKAQAVCDRIESLTGLTVWAFPKEREFFVELRLPA